MLKYLFVFIILETATPALAQSVACVNDFTGCTNGIIALPSGVAAANPTATAGPTAVNGSAVTFLRSDGAPAVQAATTGQAGITTLASSACSTSSTTVLTPASATPSTSGALLSGCVGPLRFQAGSATSDGSGNFSITFPTAFPANCFAWTTGQTNNSLVEIASCTTTQLTGNTITPSTLAAAPSKSFSYIAVGN